MTKQEVLVLRYDLETAKKNQDEMHKQQNREQKPLQSFAYWQGRHDALKAVDALLKFTSDGVTDNN